MPAYQVPTLSKPPKVKKRQVLLVASGDLRLSANQKCWPAQKEMEDALRRAVADAATSWSAPIRTRRTKSTASSARRRKGMCVFAGIDPEAHADRGRGRLAVLAPRACPAC